MNKRTDRIRSLFAQAPAAALSADNKERDTPRVSSGSVRAVKDTLSTIERENEDLRRQLNLGSGIVEIDPSQIESAPISDRISVTDDPSFQELLQSISERGQEIPILVRPHPERMGHFQVCYGHRRVAAAQELRRPVKAIVRPLSDDQLVIAQGLENSARENLSFIERAMFSLRLENAGYSRAVIQEALAIDRAEASKLVAVARSIPEDLVRAIGKAPRIGRGRWQAFAELLTDVATVAKLRDRIRDAAFQALSSDDRFAALVSHASGPTAPANEPSASIKSADGIEIAQVRSTAREAQIRIAREDGEGFAGYVISQLPKLFEAHALLKTGNLTEKEIKRG
jgi:ParB family chromosome partitioning protein